MELNAKQVGDAFRTVMLEENHNFLEDDLVLLANAFVRFAEPLIRADELENCVEIATSLNRLVGEKLYEVRNAELGLQQHNVMGNFLHHYDDHCLKKAPDDESGAKASAKKTAKNYSVGLFFNKSLRNSPVATPAAGTCNISPIPINGGILDACNAPPKAPAPCIKACP